MRHPNSVKQAQDILFVPGKGDNHLTRERIAGIMKNYNFGEEVQIKAVSFDGGPLGAWVYADNGEDFSWYYIAAGDHDNRLAVAQAATENFFALKRDY